jgi:hypothetical protein
VLLFFTAALCIVLKGSSERGHITVESVSPIESNESSSTVRAVSSKGTVIVVNNNGTVIAVNSNAQ